MSSEYNNSPSASCNYKSLGNYSGNGSTMAALQPKIGQNKIVIPSYGSIGYNTLNHGKEVSNCSGYFGIGDAYGSGAGNCSSKYKTNLCNSGQ
jgi:hypothetical protein